MNTLGPYCEDTHTSPRVLSVSRRTQYSVQEVYKRGFVERSVTIEPADRLIIQVDSARQPDIQNNPESHAMSIQEGEDLSPYLQARPIMRLDKKWKEWVLFILNLRSFALTRETYFRSRKGMSREEVVKRMYPIFQPGQNEHLYHTAIADFPGELATFLQ